MALRDITLGQYFPGNTVVHRLDPRTKLLLTVIYIVALFLCQHLLSYGVMLVTLIACILASKVGFKSILRGMKPVLVVVLITAVLNLLYTSGEGTLTEVFLEYELDDHWKASTGVMFWTGGEDTILGEYTDNDFVYLTLRYAF